MCRRATGSAFAVLAWMPRTSLSWSGAAPTFRKSSPIAERGFCGVCGSPLTLSYNLDIDRIALHVGTFDEPSNLVPQYNYASRTRLPWVCCGLELPDHNLEESW
jgi:hypothetical protein